MRKIPASIEEAVAELPLQWKSIARAVLATPAHTNQKYGLHAATHPQHCEGFYASFGQNIFAKEHWRFRLADGRQLHVMVVEDHYKVHWDHHDARSEPLLHLFHDAKETVAIGAAILVAIFGTKLSR